MTSALIDSDVNRRWNNQQQELLLNGEILLETRSHTAWGGAVTAQMYLPLNRTQVWQQVTDYSRWVQYFPALTRSEILHRPESQLRPETQTKEYKRLYQVAAKAFFLFTAQVEIYLKVKETANLAWQQIQFQMEQGTFHDFAATLKLQDFNAGTLLTYSVQATPTIPVPSQLIQQAIRLDLPTNMRKMRQVLCGR